MKSSILIIYTGGTIGMKNDAETGALVPFDFSGIYDEFPSLKRLNVDIDVLTMDPVIDSSNVTPANWAALAELIRDNYTRYDGFVVLHGTDTMSYTASALSFMLENLAKPVVFTGSQIPIGVLRTDGRENLITAIEIAGAHIGGRPEVPEVSLYFQNRLFRANRTTKRSAEALSAFRSYNYPPLAEVGVNIAYNLAAILHPTESRSSCIAAMWLLKSSHWSAISCSFRAISFCLAVISCSLTPMLFCTSEIWLLRTPIWLWSTETFSFSSDSRALAAASFFLASLSSVLCCLMDAEILSSLFCSELMLVAALAG